jgi:SAM-dependent methyltransferase
MVSFLRLISLLFHFFKFRCIKVLNSKPFWVETRKIRVHSKLFDSNDIDVFKGWKQRMISFDDSLGNRLIDKRLEGIRLWEYGNLLGFVCDQPNHEKWDVLDVGPGNSTFPAFLLNLVRNITTIDYEHPLEGVSQITKKLWRKSNIQTLTGTMLDLPFDEQSFDLVMCVSVIEHLDDEGDGRQIEYSKFIQKTKTALKEMMRTVKIGGFLYLTTDVYGLEFQGVDKWSCKRKPGNIIWSAYKFSEINDVFLKTIIDYGFTLVGGISDYDEKSLTASVHRNTYRGKHFTTFAVLATRTV